MPQFPHTQNRVNDGHIFTVCRWTGHPHVEQSKGLLIGVSLEVVAHAAVSAVVRVSGFAFAPATAGMIGAGVRAVFAIVIHACAFLR